MKLTTTYLLLLKVIIYLILFCGTNYTTAQTKQIDSVFNSLDTINNAKEKVMMLSRYASSKRYAPQTRKFINLAISSAKKEKDTFLIANTFYALGNYFYYNSKLDSSSIVLDKAFEYFQKNTNADPSLGASITSTKAGVYKKLGALVLATSTFLEAQKSLDTINTSNFSIEEKNRIKAKKMVVVNSLANLYNETENYNKALLYYNKALNVISTLDASMGRGNIGIILNNKGELLIKMNQLKEAKNVLIESKKLNLQYKLPERFIATNNLNLGKLYIKLNNKPKAILHIEKALQQYKTNKYTLGILKSLNERGNFFLNEKQLHKAKKDCENAKKIALQIKNAEELMKSCNCLYKTEKQFSNNKASLTNFELYSKIKDSIFNEKNVRKITQLEMQYQFDKKDAEQQLISEKKDAEQQLIIEKKNKQKNQILAGFIIAMLLAISLFFFFKKRLKYQQTIAKQQEKIYQQTVTELEQKSKLSSLQSMIKGQEEERNRIAQDLHDSLGGLLSTVKSHFTAIFNNEKQKDKEVIIKKTNHLIDESCIEIRRISHNMMPHALKIAGLKGALLDMTDHLNQTGITTSFEMTNLPKINETNQIMIYRLVQELISNIKKHANATHILIQLIGVQNQLQITVEDDGKGFDYKTALQQNGAGLKNINNRVTYMDGIINWDTQPNVGTTVNITIPV